MRGSEPWRERATGWPWAILHSSRAYHNVASSARLRRLRSSTSPGRLACHGVTVPAQRDRSSFCRALRARSAARAPTPLASEPPPPRSRGSSRSRSGARRLLEPVDHRHVHEMERRQDVGEDGDQTCARSAGMTVAASLADRADRTADSVETLDQARLRRHPHGDACIDHQIVSGGVTALVAGQIHGSVGNVFGRTGTIQR